MTTLAPAATRFRDAARALGLDPDILTMTEPTRTATEAAEACGVTTAQIVKSLVFQGRDSARPYLILVSGPNRVDEEAIAAHIGEPLARMEVRAVRELTGYAIGGIPPLGHATALPTFMDEDLLRFRHVFAAAGTPNTLFSVDPARLREAVRATVIPVAAGVGA